MRTKNRSSEAFFVGTSIDRQHNVWNALREAKKSGQSTTQGLLTEFAISKIVKESAHLPRRSIKNWEQVSRVTLYTKPEKQSGLVTRAASTVLRSSQLAPNAHFVGQIVASDVRRFGEKALIEPLMLWRPNRIGFNYMNGDPHRHALIPMHVDPTTEHGVSLAIDLTGESVGSVHVVLAKDTCDELRIHQAEHHVTSGDDRVSLTIAQLGIANYLL